MSRAKDTNVSCPKWYRLILTNALLYRSGPKSIYHPFFTLDNEYVPLGWRVAVTYALSLPIAHSYFEGHYKCNKIASHIQHKVHS